MLNPVAMAILAQTFSSPKERAWAIGIWSGMTGLALALGPLAGGIMVSSSLGWRYIFFINIPVGLIAIVLVALRVKENRALITRSIDAIGQILMILTLASTTFVLMEGDTLGWGDAELLGALLMAIMSVTGFILWERRTPEPVLDLRFFRSIPFSLANLIAVLAFASLATFLYLNSIYLQQEKGYPAFYTGFMMLPLAISGMIYGPVNGRILSRYGARIPLLVAGTGFVVTSCILVLSQNQTHMFWLLTAYVFMGIANASVGAPVTYMAISGMPPANTSLAAGVSSTSRQIGQTFGIAVTGILMSDVSESALSGLSSAIISGWWVMGVYGALIICMGYLATTKVAISTTMSSKSQKA